MLYLSNIFRSGKKEQQQHNPQPTRTMSHSFKTSRLSLQSPRRSVSKRSEKSAQTQNAVKAMNIMSAGGELEE